MTPSPQSLATPLSASELLALPTEGTIQAGTHLWGFGGFHGGLSLAVIASAMEAHSSDNHLRSISAHYHRPIREAFTIDTEVLRAGRSATAITAKASTSAGICTTATGIFGPDQGQTTPAVTPAAPDAPAPESCAVFSPPRELVPFGDQIEMRPVGPNRPYSSGNEAALTAWIRIVGDTDTPDARGVIFLLDALPPSYSAVLDTPHPIPTLEFTVHSSNNKSTAASPWLLVHARTDLATAGGWSTERIDAWDRDGMHLATAQQLRLTPSAPTSPPRDF